MSDLARDLIFLGALLQIVGFVITGSELRSVRQAVRRNRGEVVDGPVGIGRVAATSRATDMIDLRDLELQHQVMELFARMDVAEVEIAAGKRALDMESQARERVAQKTDKVEAGVLAAASDSVQASRNVASLLVHTLGEGHGVLATFLFAIGLVMQTIGSLLPPATGS